MKKILTKMDKSDQNQYKYYYLSLLKINKQKVKDQYLTDNIKITEVISLKEQVITLKI